MSKSLLYTPTQSLDVKYNFQYCIAENASVMIPGSDSHALLYAGYRQLLETRNGMGCYTKDIDKVNFATASVTFLYSNTDTDEGYLGEEIDWQTFNLDTSYSDRILSSMDFYEKPYKQKGVAGNKALRDEDFVFRLSQRVNAFSEHVSSFAYPASTIDSQKTLKAEVEGDMFHEKFHHSEQAIMHYLSSKDGIDALVETAEKERMAYLYGIVLDIYTHRKLCCNCNACLVGMQHSHENGFLYDLSQSLEKHHIQPRVNDNLMLSTRVSASTAGKSGSMDDLRYENDKGKVHQYDPDNDNFIFQADNNALGRNKIIKEKGYTVATKKTPEADLPNAYVGAFFVSQTFAKIELEKRLALSHFPSEDVKFSNKIVL